MQSLSRWTARVAPKGTLNKHSQGHWDHVLLLIALAAPRAAVGFCPAMSASEQAVLGAHEGTRRPPGSSSE